MNAPLELRTPAPSAAAPAPDLAAIKQRQQATWASGDYAVIGTTLQIVGENLAEAADVRAGERVLDVAAGNGNATLAAARRFAAVTATVMAAPTADTARATAPARADRCASAMLLLSCGRMVEYGPPADVLTPANIHQVFAVDALVQPHPLTGNPLVIT